MSRHIPAEEKSCRRTVRSGRSTSDWQERSKSPYANRFVGIANGKVVVIADTLTEMHRQLRKIEPDGSKCYGVDVAADYSRVEEV